MHAKFPYLFSPVRIGPVTLKNRIVFPAHLTNYAEHNLPTTRHARYYEARARGGAGLIITEEQSVHPSDRAYEKLTDAYDPAVIPGYREITAGVHRHGGKIFAQLNHNGQQASSAFSGIPVWGPSSIPDPLFQEVPKAMEKEDIGEIIAGFCRAADHVRRGGFDGVEVQGSHASILRQFMSPLTNERTDEYGGCFENRLRFSVELLRALRRAAGPQLALGVRLSGDELVDGGLTLTDMQQVAAYLCKLGLVDFINTSIANFSHLHLVIPSMYVPPGYGVYISAGLREKVAVPVFASGRINSPAQAERILAAGQADLICLARAQICDPEFVLKAWDDRHTEIRQCIACNQCCAARTGLNRALGCMQNPVAGREEIYDSVTKAAERTKKVMVIGGGPAGLEAAREAGAKGHQVTVYERENRLGGQINLLTRVPNREEFSDVIRNQTMALKALKISIKLETEVTADLVADEQPDVVIVATGSGAGPCYLPGADQPHVLTFYEVLAGREVPGDKVVLLDEIGFHQASGTAEYLCRLGKKVTVVTAGLYAGTDLMPTLDLPWWYRRAMNMGIDMITNSIVRSIDQHTVTLLNHYTGEETVIEDISAVVLVCQPRARDELYHALKDLVPEIHRIGDCLAPRRVEHAILDGFKTGRGI